MRPSSAIRSDRQPRWVIPELDVDAQIDDHTALCLRIAIDGAREYGVTKILVDLRELSDIAPEATAQFVRHDADCSAAGIELTLLIRADTRQDSIVAAFFAAGLGDRLQWQSAEPPGPEESKPAVSAPRRARRRVTAHPSASGSSPR